MFTCMTSKEEKKGLTRRKILEAGILAAFAAGGGLALSRFLPESRSQEEEEAELVRAYFERHPWPENPAEILARSKEVQYAPGAEFRGTLFFRKLMWELVQELKAQGLWSGSDESDWFAHQEVIEDALDILASAGIKGGRLTITAYEMTDDEGNFTWERLDKAIEMMQLRNMKVELAVGIDNPEYPGVRLSDALRERLIEEARRNGKEEIQIGLTPDPNFPEHSAEILDFCQRLLEAQIQRHDHNVESYYLGNEWPNAHLIEGMPDELAETFKMSFGEDFMLDMVDRAMRLTQKPIGLNTMIHPSRLDELESVYGRIFERLGKQGKLGFDVYPTRSLLVPEEREMMDDYDVLMEAVRRLFPDALVVLTELQSAPWPKDGMSEAWVDIYEEHTQFIIDFYEKWYPRILELFAAKSGATQIGVWDLHVILVALKRGYEFPVQLLQAANEAMEKNR